jgi:hypothetical protein
MHIFLYSRTRALPLKTVLSFMSTEAPFSVLPQIADALYEFVFLTIKKRAVTLVIALR